MLRQQKGSALVRFPYRRCRKFSSESRRRVQMKRLLSWLTGLVVIGGLLIGLLVPPSVSAAEIRNVADDKLAERGDKVDLNNSSVRRFQQFPGMYPTSRERLFSVVPTRTSMTFWISTFQNVRKNCLRNTATISWSQLHRLLSTKASIASTTVSTVDIDPSLNRQENWRFLLP